MIAEATSSIFQNTSFCNSINLSLIKISLKKKNLSKMGQKEFYALEGRQFMSFT